MLPPHALLPQPHELVAQVRDVGGPVGFGRRLLRPELIESVLSCSKLGAQRANGAELNNREEGTS